LWVAVAIHIVGLERPDVNQNDAWETGIAVLFGNRAGPSGVELETHRNRAFVFR